MKAIHHLAYDGIRIAQAHIGKLHLAFAQKGTDDRRGHIDAVELECVIANYLHVHLTSIAHIIIEGFLTVATETMVVTDKE